MSDDLVLDFTPVQSDILTARERFKVLVAGRRSGKTFVDNAWLLEGAATVPKSLNWYVGPTLDDALELMYEPLEDLIPDRLIASKNRTKREINLVNGSRIRGLSADKAKRGRGVDRCVLDEFAMWDNFQYVWQQEVRPALSDRQGHAVFSTTPLGMNHAYDLFLRGHDPDFPDWRSWTWTSLEGGQVDVSEIEAAKAELDPRVFRQEYEAGFETLQGRVYDNFDRRESVDPSVRDIGGDLLVGMDFNVNPMWCVLASRAGDECHVFDEIEMMTSNTEEMSREIRDRYPDRRVVVCPDPSGSARKTSAPVGQTDFTILKSFGFKVSAPSKAPAVKDRINNTQSMLLAGEGDAERRRCLFHPRCKGIIRALDGLTYKDGTSQPDKASGLDHPTDALGYLLWQEFNVLVNRSVGVRRGRIV